MQPDGGARSGKSQHDLQELGGLDRGQGLGHSGLTSTPRLGCVVIVRMRRDTVGCSQNFNSTPGPACAGLFQMLKKKNRYWDDNVSKCSRSHQTRKLCLIAARLELPSSPSVCRSCTVLGESWALYVGIYRDNLIAFLMFSFSGFVVAHRQSGWFSLCLFGHWKYVIMIFKRTTGPRPTGREQPVLGHAARRRGAESPRETGPPAAGRRFGCFSRLVLKQSPNNWGGRQSAQSTLSGERRPLKD